MSMTNLYCDESCHLEHDGKEIMVLGAIWCQKEKIKEVSERLKEIKIRHSLGKDFEMKWSKISPSKELFYLDIVTYFFDDDDIHFRALIAPKGNLHHERFNNTHDMWYYKMYFNLLKAVISPTDQYNIYLDVKDTQGATKVSKLHDVLCSNQYDFSHKIITNVQQIRSYESQLLQLVDILIGAIGYSNRSLKGNSAKVHVVELIKKKTGYSLDKSTLLRESKLNLFHWKPDQEE